MDSLDWVSVDVKAEFKGFAGLWITPSVLLYRVDFGLGDFLLMVPIILPAINKYGEFRGVLCKSMEDYSKIVTLQLSVTVFIEKIV